MVFIWNTSLEIVGALAGTGGVSNIAAKFLKRPDAVELQEF